jgi:hypothetical protein
MVPAIKVIVYRLVMMLIDRWMVLSKTEWGEVYFDGFAFVEAFRASSGLALFPL